MSIIKYEDWKAYQIKYNLLKENLSEETYINKYNIFKEKNIKKNKILQEKRNKIFKERKDKK